MIGMIVRGELVFIKRKAVRVKVNQTVNPKIKESRLKMIVNLMMKVRKNLMKLKRRRWKKRKKLMMKILSGTQNDTYARN